MKTQAHIGWEACRRQVFSLAEHTTEALAGSTSDFERGRVFEAKSIAKAMNAFGPEDCAELRASLPTADPGAVANCPNIAEPRNCYRVRCQLGKKCVKPKQITSVQREAIVRAAIASRDAALAAPSVPSAPAAPGGAIDAGEQEATIGNGWLLDSEGRRLIGTSHHYTAQSIKALIWELKALEDPRMTTQADFENRDWRAWCGTLHRVLSGLASEVPFAQDEKPADHPEAPPASAPAAEVAQLMRFYAVDSIDALIAAQAEHIEKLQSKLPQAPSFAPQRVREG